MEFPSILPKDIQDFFCSVKHFLGFFEEIEFMGMLFVVYDWIILEKNDIFLIIDLSLGVKLCSYGKYVNILLNDSFKYFLKRSIEQIAE